MEGYDIEPFWIDYTDEKAISTVLYFYHEFGMGEHLEEVLSPEEALLVLKADLDLRTPSELGLSLPDVTIFNGEDMNVKQAAS